MRGESVAALEDPEQALDGFFRRVSDISWRPTDLLQAEEVRAGFNGFEFCDAGKRSHDLNPAEICSRFDHVNLREAVVAVLCLPQLAGARTAGHAEAVANTEGEHLLQICARFSASQRSSAIERIVYRSRAVVIEAQNHASQMRVIRLGPTELIVRHIAVGTGAIWQVLHLPAPAIITDVNVKLAIGSEADHAAIVIAAEWLALIHLKSVEPDEVCLLYTSDAADERS